VDSVTAGAGAGLVDRLALAIVVAVIAQGLLVRFAQYQGHRLANGPSPAAGGVRRADPRPAGLRRRAGRTGDLATRSSVDVTNVGTAVRDVLPIMVISIVQLSLLFGAVFALQPRSGWSRWSGCRRSTRSPAGTCAGPVPRIWPRRPRPPS